MNRSMIFLCLALFFPLVQPALVSAVPVSSGDIFFDDYTAAAGALSTSEANYDQVAGTITRDGTTLATTTSDLRRLCL